MSLLFTQTKTTRFYTLSLHDALPILSQAALRPAARLRGGRKDGQFPAAARRASVGPGKERGRADCACAGQSRIAEDRKSTRLNSSHRCISYASFCLKKQKIE